MIFAINHICCGVIDFRRESVNVEKFSDEDALREAEQT